MARSINDIDLGILIRNRCVLGKDGDTSLTLKRVGIHYTDTYILVVTEYT